MDKLKPHWTQKSIGAFVHRLSFDFITQIQKKLQREHISKKAFAARLGVTPGRVSQVLNEPGNITLESAVEYARAVGMKVALVAYDDHDPKNNNGPINSEIFERCWELHGTPHDFFELADRTPQMTFGFTAYEHIAANKDFGSIPEPLLITKPEQEATTWKQ